MFVEIKTAGNIETAEKIAIIGPSGAGKTTLAKKLGSRLRLKEYHLDSLFWLPSWKRIDRETRIDILQDLIMERKWIIEGTYLNSSDLHLKEADAIIFLGIPSLICCYRIIKRHYESKKLPRHDIPLGSTNRLTLIGILQVLFFPLQARRKLEDNLNMFPEKVIRLHSPEEVERFLTQLEIYIDEMKQPSSPIVTRIHWIWDAIANFV